MPKRKQCDTDSEPISEKKRLQQFRKEYTDQFSFIIKGKNDEGSAFCTVCNSEFSIKYGGLNDITKHVGGQKHKNLSKQKASMPPLNSFFKTDKKSNDKETDVIAAEVAMVDLVVELNLPLSTLDKINKVVKKVFKDSDIAKNFQCARSKGTAIVKEISAKATLSLGERISRQPFTVSTDGSNDAECHKLYPLVIKSVNPDTLEVSSEILSIPICEGSSTGENIFNLIEAEFKAHKIPWENCLALGADNAPVMVGRDKGVYGHMSRKNPSIFMAGCVFHLIHIAAEKGAACLPLDVSQLLIDAYYYLDKSSKRQSFFKEMQLLHDVKQGKILKHVSTRWLSIKKCLPRLIENWEPLYTFFKSEESASTSATAKEKTGRLKKLFASRTNQLICKFLVDALQPFDAINTELQSDASKIHVLQQRLEKLIKQLMVKFVQPAVFQRDGIFANLEKENLRQSSDIIIGKAAAEFIAKEKSKMKESRLSEFFDAARDFYVTSITYLRAKLPLKNDVYSHAAVINPANQLTCQFQSVEFFIKRFPVLLPPNASLHDLQLEFATYQCTDIASCIEERMDKTWASISRLTEGQEPIFKLLSQVMLHLLTIPHSSAHCERIFSLVRKNHTEFRSRLENSTMEALLIAKSRPGSAGDRDYSKEELSELKSAYHRSLKN